MYSECEASIVRIYADKTVAGTGFLIAPNAVLTCAHVVATALHVPLAEEPPKPTTLIYLDFPLIAPGCTISAHIDAQCWQPLQLDGSGDIALLHLDRSM